ncbi:hypothetical protein [Muricoccus aerilatus]|uniref:hypothetical protein n=1 Tax=Muricoccus aerilatus TaxID=452982 RepID=UPI0005C175EF|nr:hypothetical protein [Roseomonas aerilata]
MVLHYEVQAYFPEDAELKLYALEHAAKQAIKLAGQGQSQVLIDQADEAILLDLLPHAKKA